MYHRAGDGLYGNPVPVLRAHFAYLQRHCRVVLPGEPLRSRQLNLCLTFDDAYADFYAHVFPLLQQFSLRAVLAVPTAFVVEQTGASLEERLSVPHETAMQGEVFMTKAPFCTWAELQQMTASGLVQAASHSHRHQDMTRPEMDVGFEAVQSKTLLEQRLGRQVSTFVYPFGKVNARAHGIVTQHYPYAMRIGSALNRNWSPRRQPLCRVEADQTPEIARLLRWNRVASYGLKWMANGARAAFGKWQ